jgi:hypothetical protein
MYQYCEILIFSHEANFRGFRASENARTVKTALVNYAISFLNTSIGEPTDMSTKFGNREINLFGRMYKYSKHSPSEYLLYSKPSPGYFTI